MEPKAKKTADFVSLHADDVGDFTERLRSVSEQARKLLAHIAELAYHGRGQERRADAAYLPELHESCGLDVDAMYALLKELQGAKLVEVEEQYPFEDVKIASSSSGWNALAAIARFAEQEKIPLRGFLADLRFELLPMSGSSHNGPNAIPSTALGQCSKSDSGYLRLLGESVRQARARLGMTRKMLAARSGVSERFLAQLEGGSGNASILILRQISQALDIPLEAMLPDGAQQSFDFSQAVELLRRLDAEGLTKARRALLREFQAKDPSDRRERIALIGLRGAGKSTIGTLLARKLGLKFFELDRHIEEASGISLNLIFDLYGQSGFRRFEQRCLQDLLNEHERFVVAVGGNLVSEPATYERLLASCYTIWLKATSEEHMSRVVAQGDMRPMAHNPEAMADLQRILAQREPLYSKADLTIDTSGRSINEVLQDCLQRIPNTFLVSS